MHFWIYPLISVIVIITNAIPMFMPATWTVLAFFYIHYHLNIVPIVIFGALGATIGRILLALISSKYLTHIIPSKLHTNYSSLGALCGKNAKFTAPLILTYAFFPIPSNQLFIAAGLANIDLSVISTSFFIGRLISYSFWVKTANYAVNNFQNLFDDLTSTEAITANVLSFLLLIAIGFIPWHKLTTKFDSKISS